MQSLEAIGQPLPQSSQGSLRAAMAASEPRESLRRIQEVLSPYSLARISKAQFARYYLRSLEMAAKGEATPWFIPNDDKQVINLEHILPQAPEGNWPQFDEEEMKSYARKIGNMALMLAKTNSDLQSGNFKKKKAIYKASPYELTRMIAQNKDWTKKEIAARQKVLADLALKAWPL